MYDDVTYIHSLFPPMCYLIMTCIHMSTLYVRYYACFCHRIHYIYCKHRGL